MIKYIILIGFLFASSQEYLEGPYDARQSFGVYGSAGLNFHLTNSFEKLPGVDGCCDGYGAGSGFGYNFGLFYDIPLGDKFELDLRLNYSDLSGLLTKEQESSQPVFNPNDPNGVSNALSEYRIDATINTFSFEPSLNFRLANQFRIRAGLITGFFLTSNVVEEEELISPSFGSYIDENGNRSRQYERFNGDLPEAPGVNFGLNFGASYDLPLNQNRTWFIVPEAKYTLGLASLHAEEMWIPNQLAGGIGLRYAPRKKAPPKKAPPIPPPPPPSPLSPPPPVAPSLDAAIRAYSIDEYGNENEIAEMKVEEFLESNVHPLLSYIFFNDNSSEIPLRYNRISVEETQNFTYGQFFNKSTLEVYYDVINIIGKRMQFYPQAEITFVGCNSNLGEEKGNLELSKNRAESVKQYLMEIWDIEANRITVKSRNLPSSPSNSNTEDGIQENRRVEIIPNFERVIEPVNTVNTTRNTNPPNLRFKPEIKSDIGVDSWKVTVSQEGSILKVFTGKAPLPKQVDWVLADEKEQRNIQKMFESPIGYQLQVVDNDGKVWQSSVQDLNVDILTIQEKIFGDMEDMEIENFSMIGFGYASAELSPLNRNTATKAKNRVSYNSDIDITGHSDRTGNAKVNKDLSEKRAFTTAEFMEVDNKFAKGLGETILLYNNDLPEGRFYSRTVKIKLETPIESFE